MSGAVELRLIELADDRFSIGRRPTSDLFLDDPSVSPEHALIGRRAGGFVLQDLHSRERTRVNGLPVRLRELVTGDLIDIGLFRLRYECGPIGAVRQVPSMQGAFPSSRGSPVQAATAFVRFGGGG